MYIMLDENGRICATTDTKEYAEGMIEFELPDDFDYSHQEDYRIEGGELVEFFRFTSILLKRTVRIRDIFSLFFLSCFTKY